MPAGGIIHVQIRGAVNAELNAVIPRRRIRRSRPFPVQSPSAMEMPCGKLPSVEVPFSTIPVINAIGRGSLTSSMWPIPVEITQYEIIMEVVRKIYGARFGHRTVARRTRDVNNIIVIKVELGNGGLEATDDVIDTWGVHGLQVERLMEDVCSA